jgi:hypothetical protein
MRIDVERDEGWWGYVATLTDDGRKWEAEGETQREAIRRVFRKQRRELRHEARKHSGKRTRSRA